MLTLLLQIFARTTVALAALALAGFTLSPAIRMISSGFLQTERPFTKDLKVRGPSDDNSDQAELFLLLVVVRDAIKEQQKLNTLHGESKEKDPVRAIVKVNLDAE